VAPHWRNGAIGNAKWTGVKVRDILRECGMDVDAIALGHKDANAKIANFMGADTDETGVPYAGVIPVDKVIDPHGDTILAYEMNGEVSERSERALTKIRIRATNCAPSSLGADPSQGPRIPGEVAGARARWVPKRQVGEPDCAERGSFRAGQWEQVSFIPLCETAIHGYIHY